MVVFYCIDYDLRLFRLLIHRMLVLVLTLYVNICCCCCCCVFVFTLVVHGVESSYHVVVLQARAKVSKEDDFLNLYLERTISHIKNSVDEGIFVVYEILTGI